MGCTKSQNAYDSSEFNLLLKLNDLEKVKEYIKSRNNMTQEMYEDSVISLFCENDFSYINFTNYLKDLEFHKYLNTELILIHLTNNQKSKYCYYYYTEPQLQYIICNVPYNNYLCYRGILRIAIEKNYINIISIILEKLKSINFNLIKFYAYLSKYFNPEIIKLFIQYNPHLQLHKYLTKDQLTTFINSQNNSITLSPQSSNESLII